jgi:NAD(P)-dependent dehydrogenase (short-subunit alcohol dehydrogenase family)
MARLEGKVVFLTGAGAGIAKATAKACAKEGARVALIEIDREAGERAEREIKAAGSEALFVPTDVTQDASVRSAVEATVQRFGRLDVLFNCAGGSLREDVPCKMDLDVWNRTIALNLLHPFSPAAGIPAHHEVGRWIDHQRHFASGLMGSINGVCAAKGGSCRSPRRSQRSTSNTASAPMRSRRDRYVRKRQIKRYENSTFMMPITARRERAAFQKPIPPRGTGRHRAIP